MKNNENYLRTFIKEVLNIPGLEIDDIITGEPTLFSGQKATPVNEQRRGMDTIFLILFCSLKID